MDQEVKAQPEKKGGSKGWVWIVVVLLVILIGGAAYWYFTKGSNDSNSETATVEPFTPKHSDWQKYESSKYKFTLYHPGVYTVQTGNTGTLKFIKDGVEMADLYVYSASGEGDRAVTAQVALFTDASKGYMTGGVESSTIAAEVNAKQVTGTFGKNAGISQTHAGIKGKVVIFVKDSNLYVIDSYDNGDTTAISYFDDIVSDMRF